MSRHSSFSRSSPPRPWRSPSKPADPQASLSLVFAEPEHAISGDTTMSPSQQPSGEADSSTNLSRHRQNRPDASSSLRRASYASLKSLSKQTRRNTAVPDYSVNSETPGTHANGEISTSPNNSLESVGVDQATTPRNASRRPSQPAGWLGSLKRKRKLVPLESGEDHTRPVGKAESPEESLKAVLSPHAMTPESTNFKSTPSSAVAVPFPISDTEPPSKAPVDVKPRPQAGGWFSGKAASRMTPVATDTKDEASGSVQSSPETLQAPLPVDIIARKSSLPQDIPHQKKVDVSAGAKPFTVACPFTIDISVPSSLDDSVPVVSSFSPPSPTAVPARARERTLSNLSSLNPSSSRFILSMPLLGRPKLPLDQVVAQVGQASCPTESREGVKGSTLPEAEKLENAGHGSQAPRGSNLSGTGSWWGYIGLESSSPVTSSPLPLTESLLSTAGSQTLSPDSVSNTKGPDSLALRPSADLKPLITSSIASTDSASTWYTPWRWYEGAATSVDPEPQDVGKTQAELVREEALARSELSSSQPAPTSPPVTESLNPIVTSTESRLSWVSFLSSQTFPSLNIRGVKEKDEVVEGMNLDDANGVIAPSWASGSSAVPVTKLPPPLTSKRTTEPPQCPATAPSLTNDNKSKIISQGLQQPSSLSPKKAPPRLANLVLPTFEDTFETPPRSVPIPRGASAIRRTIRYVSEILFPDGDKRGTGKCSETDVMGRELPRTWGVLGEQEQFGSGGLKGMKRVVVIGIHGWFPGSIIRQVIGEPKGTSQKFANMLASAVEDHFNKHGTTFDKLTKIALEGEGTIEHRVNSLYQEYLNHLDWVEDLQKADAILLATHSQGSIVSTQLLHRLISEGHIRTERNEAGVVSPPPQRVCCVAMCGIHMGPLLYLNTSSLRLIYGNRPAGKYFESAAARELFEFQDSESPVSQTYVKALKDVLEHGVKFTYIASLNDQVVPIYSGCFSTVAHPLILRALYIDGDAYNSSDFLSNLLILLLRIRNAGLDDGGLITHLSEATAGSLSGVGHSSAYEEPATYSLAVRFLFEASGALGVQPELAVQPFTARAARNDYEIPWALRDLIANPDVASIFSSEISELRAAFDDWHPRTTVLREIRRKLEPIRRLPKCRL